MRRGRSLFSRLVATHLLIAVVALAALGVTIDRLFEHRALAELEQRLTAEARSMRSALERTGVDESFVRVLGRSSGARLTVIRPDGVVLADSEHDPATMENHATRPEVRAALAGHIGVAERTSATLGSPFLYIALPPQAGLIVRAALPESQIASQRVAIRWSMGLTLLAIAVIAAIVSAIVARTLSRPLGRIADQVNQLASGTFTVIEPGGPRETRALAIAVNAMAADLAAKVEQIRDETELREGILSTMSEGVILAEGERVVYANPAARAMLGDDSLSTVPATLPRAGDGDTAVAEVRLHHPNARDLRVATTPTAAGANVIVLLDVTEAKRLDRTRRDFVANASHEMKTPVAAILATAETLEHAIVDDPEAARRFTSTLATETRRLSELVSDLLDLARLDEPIAAEGILDLRAVIAAAAEEARARAGAAGIRFRADIATDVMVRGRADDIALLVRNLLDNAIRYTPAGGDVTLTLRTRGSFAEIEVRDTGMGIPSKDLPRVFERFFRVDQARARATGGTGLGLAIVRHVAETHGGTVSVESELGTGSAFIVRIPLSRAGT